MQKTCNNCFGTKQENTTRHCVEIDERKSDHVKNRIKELVNRKIMDP